jgi:uncharacterized protein (DUF1810 family)
VAELSQGQKQTCWIWWELPHLIFEANPSATSREYALLGLTETRAYLRDATLRTRLFELWNVLLVLDEGLSITVEKLMVNPKDVIKLHAHLTLFFEAGDEVARGQCEKLLLRYYAGKRHAPTELLLTSKHLP